MKHRHILITIFICMLFMFSIFAFATPDENTGEDVEYELSDIELPIIELKSPTVQPTPIVEKKVTVVTPTPTPTPEPVEEEVELSFIEQQEVDYIEKYRDLFFDKKYVSDEQFLIEYDIASDNEADNPLTHLISGYFTEKAADTWKDPMIIIMLIEEKGEYQPLYSLLEEDNYSYILETSVLFTSSVDLKYVEKQKNNLRLIAFKKSNYDMLKLNENLQITDLSITVSKKPSFFEADKGSFKDALDAFQQFLEEGKGIDVSE